MPKVPCIYIATHDFSAFMAQASNPGSGPESGIEHLLHPDDLQPLASHPKRRFIQQFSRWQRRRLFADVLQLPGAAINIQTDQFGKPYLHSHPQLAFNQSHSDNLLALCYSFDVAHVGIDVEDKNRVMRVEALAKHSLTNAEYARFQQAADQQAYWLKLWTIKEAVLKASGIGIRLSLNELETGYITMQQPTGTVFHPKIGQWQYACYELEQHVLSVSWPASTAAQTLQILFREDGAVQV